MKCQKCNSERVLSFCCKISDMNCLSLGDKDYDGYMLGGLNLDDGTGDYLEGEVCLDCGQLQGKWPAETPEEL